MLGQYAFASLPAGGGRWVWPKQLVLKSATIYTWINVAVAANILKNHIYIINPVAGKCDLG